MENEEWLSEACIDLDENGSLDESWTLDDLIRTVVGFTFVLGVPIWLLSMIPDYLESWQKRPGLTGCATQCFLFWFSPIFLGIARALADSNRRVNHPRIRFWQIVVLSTSVLGFLGSFALLVWDLYMLDTFLALYQRDREVAIQVPLYFATSMIMGVGLGWLIGKWCDEDLRESELELEEINDRG